MGTQFNHTDPNIASPELVAELIITCRKASGIDIAVVEIDLPAEPQNGNVVGETLGIELWVNDDPGYTVFLMLNLLWAFECTGIILSYPHFQTSDMKAFCH